MSIPPRTMDVNALPSILERKRTLRGQEKTFLCRVLDRAPDTLTVLFISDRAYTVGGLTLPAGTVTFGHFWQTEPYNVYHWLTPQGATIAHYFNLTTDTVIGTEELSYLDLTVDVLLRVPAPPAILDAAEVPADVSPALRARIAQALATVLSRASHAPAVLEAHADRLWQRLYAKARR
jgi:hypothetical protein